MLYTMRDTTDGTAYLRRNDQIKVAEAIRDWLPLGPKVLPR